MPKLTKSFIDGIVTDGKEAIYWDTELPCFGLRVKPTGSKSYVVQYRNKERLTRKFTIGKHGAPWTPEEARKKAKNVLLDVGNGHDPASKKVEEREALTITELSDSYIKDGPSWKPDKKQSIWDADAAIIKRHIKCYSVPAKPLP